MKGCRPLTEAELTRLIEAVGGRYASRDRALIITGARTGFRMSELLSLTLDDVLRSGKWLERITVRRRHMKGGKGEEPQKAETRSVPMHPEVRTALAPWLAEMKRMGYMRKQDFVFQSRAAGNRAISLQQAWRILKRAAERAGLVEGIATHSLRKTFAAAMDRAFGGDIFKVAQALGHKDVKSTQSYMSFKEEEIDAAILGKGKGPKSAKSA